MVAVRRPTAILALVFSGATACSPGPALPRPFGVSRPTYQDGARLVVVGDVQRTSKLEVGREKNDSERRRILEGIAEAEPDLVAFTGDLVFDGGSESHWAEFDDLSAPIRSRKIAMITAFGNHEYWGGRERAEANVFSRFPIVQRRHWYTVAFGPLLLVVLDSNKTHLQRSEWEAQKKWYEEALDAADASADTRGVLVLLHHPPFTNSTVTGDEEHVKQAFLPALLRAKKTLAMAAGHVHNFERFAQAGKMLIVSGGGGGPRHELASGGRLRHPGDLFAGPPTRDFHFTIYAVSGSGLHAEVRGLRKSEHDFYTMDQFDLPFPP